MVYYKYNYKYLVAEDATVNLNYAFNDLEHEFFSIKGGVLSIKKGYAWDGASGPTIDTKNSIVPSLVHDCLYQAMRLGLLDESKKADADKEFYKLLRSYKMNFFRAKVWYLGVKLFAGSSCKKGNLQGKEIKLIA